MTWVQALIALALALALDLLVGEPPDRWHPVVWMGKTIAMFARRAPRDGKIPQFLAGLVIAVAVPLLFAIASAQLLRRLEPWPVAEVIVGALLLKASFAFRALGRAAANVRQALGQNEIGRAREGLRSLCSRDPTRLEEPLVVAATVESVAENASDSFVAPLLAFLIFGIPGAIFYRAVNTADAMIGYHGEYEYLGKAAARLDDLLNLIPARLTAFLILVGGLMWHEDFGNGLKILRRDGKKTESPNAGRPMAAMAGVLRVELEKREHYRLGDPLEALSAAKIDQAWRIVTTAAVLMVLAGALVIGVGHARFR